MVAGPSTSARVAAIKAIFSRPHWLGSHATPKLKKLLVERVSQRAIVPLTSVSRMTVAKLAKSTGSASGAPQAQPAPVLELNEL
ncbi:hypothetical protein GCM10027348_18820 [Hymenobacter tenuis]